MPARPPLFSLVRRIILSVALCLTAILILHLLVALWTIEESTQAAFRERETLAKVLAERVDDVLAQALSTLQAEAAHISGGAEDRPTDEQFHHLSALGPPHGMFRTIAAVDADGVTRWGVPTDESETTLSDVDRQGFQAVLVTGQPTIAEFAVGKFNRAQLIVPLMGPAGQPHGALIAEIDPGDLGLGLLPRRSIDGGVVAQLMGADGRLLTGTGIPGPRGAREHAILMADLFVTQTSGYRVHEPSPGAPYTRHVVAYAPVRTLSTWGVAVEQPIDEVLAMPKQLQRRLAVTGAASFALIVALAWFDVRRVVRPLTHLTEAAARIADGHLDEPLRVNRGDELGILARTFETMRLQLRASVAKLQNVAVLEERERIAREMHDGLGQVLGYVNTKTLAAARLLEVGKVDEARLQLAQLEAAAKDAYADVREAILGLRTTLDSERHLLAALKEYVEGFEQQSGIAVELDVAAWPRQSEVALTTEVQLVRIVQEALANVRKHARAQRAAVSLIHRDDAITVTVEDDGRGFDPSQLDREGGPRFGLQMMRERAEGVGGTLVLHSRPGAGTRLTFSVPACRRAVQASTERHHATNARTVGR